jgi:acyl-CoA synthetase (AMP-forming)/AMP-acid ligase II
MVIGDLIRNTARRVPEQEAIVCGERRVNWRELNLSVNRLANGLRAAGIEPGDRIAFIMGNTLETVRLYYAIAKLGGVAVPIMQRSVAREITHIVNEVSATALISSADQSAAVRDALTQMSTVRLVAGVGQGHGLPCDLDSLTAAGSDEEPPVVVDPDSLYAVLFTSGTTGAPKGCMLTHRNKVLSRMSMLMEVSYHQNDRALLFMPLTASLGADMLHTHVLRGTTTVLLPRFDEAEMFRLIEVERITVLYALESTFDRLIGHPDLEKVDWASVRYFFATSATRDLRAGATRLAAMKNFRAKLWNAYGCTEGGGWLTFLGPEEIEAAAAADEEHGEIHRSIGRECNLARVDCLGPDGESLPAGEIGEMVLAAPWLFSGYWGLPERTREALKNGRYFTGDLARKDSRGYIFLEGRMKDMIKSGGLSVYPAEVELVLKAHPKVREVAVVGVSDAEWGEKVVACVIPEGICEEGELIEFCRRELAGYKTPKAVVFLVDFPRDVVGKILKRQLREQLTRPAKSL